MMAMDRAGIDAQVPQQPEGECHFLYSQEFWFLIFTSLVFVLMATTAMAMAKIERKVRHRITRCLIELGGDHRMGSFV